MRDDDWVVRLGDHAVLICVLIAAVLMATGVIS